jgi:hypothetical protein
VLNIWNWKAAIMSAIYRAPIFFLTTLKAGWRPALSAMLLEGLFRAFTSGFYGAITQALRSMEPLWLAIFIISVILPGVVQGLDFIVHWIRGTPNGLTGVLVSIIVTGVASLFNWFAMRRGTLLTGGEGQSFAADLRSLPGIIVRFAASGPLALWRLSGQGKKVS